MGFENNDGTNNTVMQEVPQSFLMVAQMVPGPPFVFGALRVILALIVAAFIPENMGNERSSNQGSRAFDHHSDHSTASKNLIMKSPRNQTMILMIMIVMKVTGNSAFP